VLLGVACFLFAGTVWSGTKAHAVELSPARLAEREALRLAEARAELLGKLQLAGIATRRAGPALLRMPRPAVRDVSPAAQEIALARYTAVLGVGSIQSAVSASGSQLAHQVLDDPRITLTPAARGDVASGSVDPRVLALLGYLAEAHGQITVSCLLTGHSHYVAQTKAERERGAPRRVSAHVYGHAVDVSSIGGTPVLGHQQPGGVVEQAIEEILSLPPALQPRQVISLLSLSGPSFRLPDHADHLHIGF